MRNRCADVGSRNESLPIRFFCSRCGHARRAERFVIPDDFPPRSAPLLSVRFFGTSPARFSISVASQPSRWVPEDGNQRRGYTRCSGAPKSTRKRTIARAREKERRKRLRSEICRNSSPTFLRHRTSCVNPRLSVFSHLNLQYMIHRRALTCRVPLSSCCTAQRSEISTSSWCAPVTPLFTEQTYAKRAEVEKVEVEKEERSRDREEKQSMADNDPFRIFSRRNRLSPPCGRPHQDRTDETRGTLATF